MSGIDKALKSLTRSRERLGLVSTANRRSDMVMFRGSIALGDGSIKLGDAEVFARDKPEGVVGVEGVEGGL